MRSATSRSSRPLTSWSRPCSFWPLAKGKGPTYGLGLATIGGSPGGRRPFLLLPLVPELLQLFQKILGRPPVNGDVGLAEELLQVAPRQLRLHDAPLFG